MFVCNQLTPRSDNATPSVRRAARGHVAHVLVPELPHAAAGRRVPARGEPREDGVHGGLPPRQGGSRSRVHSRAHTRAMFTRSHTLSSHTCVPRHSLTHTVFTLPRHSLTRTVFTHSRHVAHLKFCQKPAPPGRPCSGGGKAPDQFRSIDVGPARCVPVGKVDELADAEATGETGVDCVLGGKGLSRHCTPRGCHSVGYVDHHTGCHRLPRAFYRWVVTPLPGGVRLVVKASHITMAQRFAWTSILAVIN
jgi:hypothetical protein